MGRQFYEFLMYLSVFYLSISNVFFNMGRKRFEELGLFVSIKSVIGFMGRSSLKIGISDCTKCDKKL